MKNISNSITVQALLFIVLLKCLAFSVKAQSYYEEYQKTVAEQYQDQTEAVEQRYLKSEAQRLERVQLKHQKIVEHWGKEALLNSKPKKWVKYSSDYLTRITMDYEEGRLYVETLMLKSDVKAKEKIAAATSEALSGIIEEAPGLLAHEDGTTVEASQIDEYAIELAQTALMGKSFVGDGTEQRVEVSIAGAMLSNHLEIRARQVAKHITRYAGEYGVPEALILAMMHTESAFNPKAQSAAPAYGLLQLVPISGGREAYRYVFAKDGIPTPQYLWNPEQNIQLGVAYMRVLLSHYFGDIKKPESRLYCAIAAYNTGIGNVAKTFTGKRKIHTAVAAVNQLTPKQVYEQLMAQLPAQETKDYLERVLNRMKIYQGKDG